MNRYVRLLCLLLALVLLPLQAFCEAYSYDITFSSVPARPGTITEGVLDLLNMVRAKGEMRVNDNPELGFDTTLDITLEDDPKTNLDFHIYGVESNMHAFSSLWNDENLFINLPAMLEFSMKIYNHMDIPLQRLFILYPFLTVNAFFYPVNYTQDYLAFRRNETGEKTVDLAALQEMGNVLGDLLYGDRAFRNWLSVMGSINQAGEELSYIWETWPEYAVSMGEIISIQTEDERVWKRAEDDTVLFRETWSDNGSATVRILMPGFINGTDMTMDYVRTAHDGMYDVDLTFSIGEGEQLMLSGTFTSRNIPGRMPAKEQFTLDFDFHGPLLSTFTWLEIGQDGYLDAVSLTDSLKGSVRGGPDGISLMDGDTELVTIHMKTGDIEMGEMPEHTVYEMEGLEITSLYDTTLNELVEDVKENAIEKGIPIIIHAPVTTVSAVMDALQDSGVLDLLVSGFSFGEGGGEEEWDEYSEEYGEYDSGTDYEGSDWDEPDWYGDGV